MSPQYIDRVYFMYDRMAIQFFLISIINIVVFLLLVYQKKIDDVIQNINNSLHIKSYILFLGFVGIYIHTKKKILPVALNSGLCWPKHSWILKNGLITIKILPAINANYDKKTIMNKVQETIESASNKLLNS